MTDDKNGAPNFEQQNADHVSPELTESIKSKKKSVWHFRFNTSQLVNISDSFLTIIGCRDTNVSAEEKWLDTADSEDYSSFLQQANQCHERGVDDKFQFVIRHETDENRHVYVLYQAYYSESKKCISGLFFDLSYKSDQEYEVDIARIVENFKKSDSNSPIYVLDADGFFQSIPGRRAHVDDFVPYESIVGKCFEEVFPKDKSQFFRKALSKLKKTGNLFETISYELSFGANGMDNVAKHFETTIIRVSDEYFLALSQNRTKDKQALHGMEQRINLQDSLLQVSKLMLNKRGDNNDCKNEAVKIIGNAVQCDRVYIFEFDWTNGLVSNTNEWCNDGINSEIENLQNFPITEVNESWIENHKRGEPYSLLDVPELASDNPMKPVLLQQGIKSLVTVPIGQGKELFGFVGFDWVQKKHMPFEQEINLLKMFANLLYSSRLQSVSLKRIQTEKLYSAELIKEIPLPVFVMDKNGEVRDVNSAFCDLLQLEKSEVIGQHPPYSWWSAEQFNETQEAYSSFAQSNTFTGKLNFQRADNSIFPALVEGKKIQALDETIFYATIKDLTEFDSIKKDLKKTKNWLKISQRTARMGHFVYDFQNGEIDMSLQIKRLIGVTEGGNFSVSQLASLISFTRRKKYLNEFKRALEDRRRIEENIELIRLNDGVKVWLHISGIINYDAAGDAIDFQGTVRDTTAEVNYVKRIETQNERLREIARIQSHEFRAPLIQIMSLTDSLHSVSDSRFEMDVLKTIRGATAEIDKTIGKVVQMAESFDLGSVNNPPQNNKRTTWEIVVVDDDPIISKLALLSLKSFELEYESKSFTSGEPFIEYLKSEFVDESDKMILLLLDINMPKVDGWDVLKFISQHGLENRLEVAMFTSSISLADKKKSMLYPFVREFIEKPLQKDVLKDLLSKLNLI